MTLSGIAQLTGRGPDSMLVHMSPREVQTLQTVARAHGGSLTVNPTTGLPEAGFLDAVLPAVAGIGLSMIPGVGPLMAAGITGLGTGLLTGSLEKGLTAGLGAYGAAGLGSGLANLGASAGSAATSAGAGAGAAGASGASGMIPTMSQIMGQTAGGISPATPMMGDIMSQVAGNAPLVTGALPAAQAPSFMGNLSNLGSGLQQAFNNPSGALEAMGGLKGIGGNAYLAAIPALASQQQQDTPDRPEDTSMIRPYTFTRTPTGAPMGQRQFDQRFTARQPVRANAFPGFESGGEVNEPPAGLAAFFSRMPVAAPKEQVYEFSRTPVAEGDTSGRHWDQKFTLRDMTQADRDAGLVALHATSDPKAARGSDRDALAQLLVQPGYTVETGVPGQRQLAPGAFAGYSGFASGGHLQGPGDGMSDDIPAVIDGVQPAALSTDEFVIPADAVSSLGNGSSSAGAKELQRMVNRIRMKTHGRPHQQRKIQPHTVLSA